MPSIDQRVVQMLFDNKQFEQGVEQSRKSLDNLKKSMEFDKATTSLANLEKVTKGVNFSAIERGVDAISEKFTMLGVLGQTAMHRIADAAINAGERAVKAISIDNIGAGFSKYETKTKAVQTIMNATKKPIEEVNAVLEDLSRYTDETSYDFSTMVSTIGKFTSAGVDLKVAEKAMEGIANEAAVSGAGIEEANRAMYNFAQALSAGSVKYMDWKSIANANMSTKEFKEELIKTAVEMGTLKKKGDAVGSVMKQTSKATKKHAAQFKETVVDYKSFENTLSSGWLTSNVLIKTLEKYSDTGTEFGRKAYEAAQKALTYKDAIQAIKDAVSSGWMRTFELLFGNLEESIDLWTNFCNAIYEFTSIFSDARNDLLQGWHDHEGYNKAVEAASNIWRTFMNVVNMVGSALESVFPPVTYENLVNATEKVRESTEKLRKVLGWTHFEETEEKIKTAKDYAEELNSVMKKGAKSQDVKLLQERLLAAGIKLDKYGADGIYGSETEKAVKELQKKIGADVTGAWDESTRAAAISAGVFKEWSEESKSVNKQTDKITPTMRNLRNITKGFFSIIHIGASYLKTGFDIVKHFLSLFNPVWSGLVKIASIVGRLFTNLDKNLTKTGHYTKILDTAKKLLEPLENALKKVGRYLDYFYNRYNSKIHTFGDLFKYIKIEFKKTNLYKTIAPIWEKIEPIASKISGFLKTIKDSITGFFKTDTTGAKNFGEALKKRFESFSKIGDWIKTNIIDKLGIKTDAGKVVESKGSPVNVIQTIIEKISGIIDFAKGLDLGQLAMLALTIASVIKMYKALKAPTEFLTNIAELPKTLNKKLKGKSLADTASGIGEAVKNLGIGIGILAAAVYFIAQLDAGKAWGAVGVIAALSAIVLGFSYLMSKVDSSVFDTGLFEKNKTIGIIAFATSMMIMAMAVDKLAKLPIPNMIAGVLGLGVIMGEIVAFAKLTEKLKSPKGFMDLGGGLTAIVSAVSAMAKIPFTSLVKALVGLGVILLELGIFLKIANGKEFKNGPAQMVGIGASVIQLAKALTRMAKLSWEEIGKGLAALGGVLLELGIFLHIASGTKSGSGLLDMKGIGVAVTSLTNSLIKISKLSWEEIGKGLAGLGGVMLELAIFMKLIGGNSALKQIGLAFALVGLGFALTLFVTSIKSLGRMNTKHLVKGITALGVIFLEIAGFLKLVGSRNPTRMVANAIAMVGIGIALNLIAVSLKSIGKMKFKDILKGVVGIGIIFLELAAFMKMSGGVKASLSAIPMMIALAGSLLIFGMTLKMVAGIPWTTIAAFGVGFGVALTGIGNAMMFLSVIPISGAIKALVNLDLFFANLLIVLGALGGLEKLTKGGLSDWLTTGAQVLGKAIGGFIKGIIDPFKNNGGAGRKSNSIANYLNSTIADLSGVMDNLKPFLDKVGSITDEQVKGVGNLVEILAMMTGEEILDSISGWISKGLNGGEGSGSGFVDFADSLIKLAPKLKTFSEEASGISAESMQKAADALTSFKPVIDAAMLMSGGEVVDAIAAWISGESGESAFVNFAQKVSEVMPKLINIGSYGNSVDVDGLATAAVGLEMFAEVTKSVESLGWAEVVTKIADFFSSDDSVGAFANRVISVMPKLSLIGVLGNTVNVSGLSAAASAINSLASITGSVKTLGWGEVATEIADFFSSDDSVGAFASRIISLLPKLSSIGRLASGVDSDGVAKAAGAVDALSAMSESAKSVAWDEFISKIADFLTGQDSVAGFTDDMIDLMPKLVSLGSWASLVDSQAILNSSSALSALGDVADHVPKANGLVQAIVGEANIDSFGDDLKTLGAGLYSFYNETKNIPADYNPTGMTAAMTNLAGIADAIPSTGGLMQGILGEKSLSQFSEDLKTLGEGLSSFATSTKDIPTDYDVTGPVNALTALGNLESELEEHGGVKQWFTGEKDLGVFGQEIGTLGTNLKTFFDSTKDVNSEKIQGLGTAIGVLAGAVKDVPTIDVLREDMGSLQWLIDNLTQDLNLSGLETLGGAIIASVAGGMSTEAEIDDITAPKKQMTLMLAAVSKSAYEVIDSTGAFSGIGNKIDKELGEGIKAKESIPKSHFARTVNHTASNVTGNSYFLDKFIGAGENLTRGFAQGIRNKEWVAIASFVRVVNQAYRAGLNAARIQSPSKKTEWMGEMLDMGLVQGLEGYSYRVDTASENVVNSALTSAQIGLKAISSVIENDIDTTPTIRPVLDLTDIQNGASGIGGLFGSQSIGVSSSSMASSIARRSSDNASVAVENPTTDLSGSIVALNERINTLDESIRGMKVILDTGAVVGGIGPEMDRYLGKAKLRKNKR